MNWIGVLRHGLIPLGRMVRYHADPPTSPPACRAAPGGRKQRFLEHHRSRNVADWQWVEVFRAGRGGRAGVKDHRFSAPGESTRRTIAIPVRNNHGHISSYTGVTNGRVLDGERTGSLRYEAWCGGEVWQTIAGLGQWTV